jgi:hypothetical protein
MTEGAICQNDAIVLSKKPTKKNQKNIKMISFF